jgi:CheY-like chemotaxis protein
MDRKACILHVEDDPIDVINLERAFARCGIANPIRRASNGEEALALLRGEQGAPGLRPGVILLDLGMPLMSGLEFLREVKSDPELRRIPIVVLTASRHESDLALAYELGAAGYVVKPIDFEEFVAALGTVGRYWALCETP